MSAHQDPFSPYCPRCGSCGEDLCCDTRRCDEGDGCQYPGFSRQADPQYLQAMAERWDSPQAPEAVVRFSWDPAGKPLTVGYLLRLVATAMEEAGEP